MEKDILKRVHYLTLLLALVLFAGCFESSTEPKDEEDIVDAQKSQRLVASADSVISEMINTGAVDESYDSMIDYIQEAEQMYKEASDQDPSNSKANFGSALFGFQGLMCNPDIKMITDTLEVWDQDIENLDNTRYIITQYFMHGIDNFYIDYDDGWGWNEWVDPFNAFGALIYFVQNSFSDQNVVSMLQNMIDTSIIAKLNESINYMDKVLTDNNFVYDITSEMTGEDDSFELDLGEAYMISAIMHFMRASMNIINAYQLSVPNVTGITDYTDLTILLPLIKSQDENNGPMLSLRSTNRLPSAKKDITDALTMIEQGCTFITNETDSQLNDLIQKEDLTEADAEIDEDFTIDSYDIPIPLLRNATSIISLAGKIKTMLNGPFNVEIETDDYGTEIVSVNLAAFLNNAMLDLKDKIPYHRWNNLDDLENGFYGPGIEHWGHRTIDNIKYYYFYTDLIWDYEDAVGGDDLVDYYEYLGSISEDGILTIEKAYKYIPMTGYTLVDLPPGTGLTTDNSIYLDSQNRLCITETAYEALNSYAVNAPRNSWIAFEMLDYASSLASKNYSPDHPFGVRDENGIFYFAGTPEYIGSVNPAYFTDGPSGERIDIDEVFPVFPDPTFGGILPGMTQQRLEELSN